MRTLPTIVKAGIQQDGAVAVDLLQIIGISGIGDLYFARFDRTIIVGSIPHIPLGFEPGPVQAPLAPEKITVSVSIDDAELILHQAILGRGIDPRGARLKLLKAVISALDPSLPSITIASNDVILQFSGSIDTVSFGDSTVEVQAVSAFNRPEELTPRRLLKPTCNYQFGDDDCTVDTNNPYAGIPPLGAQPPADPIPGQIMGGTYMQWDTGYDPAIVAAGATTNSCIVPAFIGITTPLTVPVNGWRLYVHKSAIETANAWRYITGFVSGTGEVSWTGPAMTLAAGDEVDLYRPSTLNDNKFITRASGNTSEPFGNTALRADGLMIGLYPFDYFALGTIQMLSGPNTGFRSTIVRMTGSPTLPADPITGMVFLRKAFPVPMIGSTTGDIVVMQRGCGKQFTDCAVFNNQPRFGGFPSVARVQARGGEVY